MKRPSSQITWATDLQTGERIRADRAEYKPGKGRYRCLDPECNRDLTVARSKNGRQHFKHFRCTHPDTCLFHNQGRPQTRHKAAQLSLYFQFCEALKHREPMPLFRFDTPTGPHLVLPFILAEQVVMEWVCPLTGRRADLALLDSNGVPVLLIEVWHTSAVKAEKQYDLRGYWWVEVGANQVLDDSSILVIKKHGNLPERLALVWEQFCLFADWRES